MYPEFPSSSLSIYLVPNAPFLSRGNVFGVSLPCPWISAQLPVVGRLWSQTVSAVMYKTCSVTYAQGKLKYQRAQNSCFLQRQFYLSRFH